MASPVAVCYSYEDLDWLRDNLGMAHLELDPWGSLIVSPATDEHDIAQAVLDNQAVDQLHLPAGCVRANGFAWIVPGGSGYLNMPDLAVIAPGSQRVGGWHLEPPPLLVSEIASPSTRKADRGRKLSDYRLGGAGLYLLVDLPGLAPVDDVTFEAHDFGTNRKFTATGAIDLTVGGRPVRFDLRSLEF
ncbi:MAG: Uma2 family endonuclease [Acidimicrobiales bacterium]